VVDSPHRIKPHGAEKRESNHCRESAKWPMNIGSGDESCSSLQLVLSATWRTQLKFRATILRIPLLSIEKALFTDGWRSFVPCPPVLCPCYGSNTRCAYAMEGDISRSLGCSLPSLSVNRKPVPLIICLTLSVLKIFFVVQQW
jgi:hypothetical protein